MFQGASGTDMMEIVNKRYLCVINLVGPHVISIFAILFFREAGYLFPAPWKFGEDGYSNRCGMLCDCARELMKQVTTGTDHDMIEIKW